MGCASGRWPTSSRGASLVGGAGARPDPGCRRRSPEELCHNADRPRRGDAPDRAEPGTGRAPVQRPPGRRAANSHRQPADDHARGAREAARPPEPPAHARMLHEQIAVRVVRDAPLVQSPPSTPARGRPLPWSTRRPGSSSSRSRRRSARSPGSSRKELPPSIDSVKAHIDDLSRRIAELEQRPAADSAEVQTELSGPHRELTPARTTRSALRETPQRMALAKPMPARRGWWPSRRGRRPTSSRHASCSPPVWHWGSAWCSSSATAMARHRRMSSGSLARWPSVRSRSSSTATG